MPLTATFGKGLEMLDTRNVDKNERQDYNEMARILHRFGFSAAAAALRNGDHYHTEHFGARMRKLQTLRSI